MRVAVDPALLYWKRGPGLAIVRGLIEVWLDLAEGVTIKSCVGRALVEAACLNRGNPGKLGEVRHIADDIRPGFGAVASNLQIAIIGADPDDLAILRRFRDGINRGVHFGRRV